MSFIKPTNKNKLMVEKKTPVSKPKTKEKETKMKTSKENSKVKTEEKKIEEKKVKTKKSTTKKSEPKKKVSKASDSKKTQTKSTKKVEEKKVETKKSTTKKTKKKISESKLWKVLSLVLVIVVVFLAFAIGIKFFTGTSSDDSFEKELDKKVEDLNNPILTTPSNTDVSLLIVEDKNCANCQVDFLAEQIKLNLIPNLTVEKTQFDSDVGSAITQQLGIKIVPVFLFSKNLEQRKDWEKLASVMIPVEISGAEYFLLNPMAIEFKTLIETPIQTESAITYGNKDAKVTLVEFSDFECPVCALMKGSPELTQEFKTQNPTFIPTIPKIMEEYVETGKVKYVFYNFPIDRIHQSARAAHNAGLCANEQNKFKEYSDVLYQKRSKWVEHTNNTKQILTNFAKDLDLDKSQFETCMETQKYNDQIDSEMKLALPYGVAGTPTYFVNKQIITGLVDYETFKSVVESELEKSQ